MQAQFAAMKERKQAAKLREHADMIPAEEEDYIDRSMGLDADDQDDAEPAELPLPPMLENHQAVYNVHTFRTAVAPTDILMVTSHVFRRFTHSSMMTPVCGYSVFCLVLQLLFDDFDQHYDDENRTRARLRCARRARRRKGRWKSLSRVFVNRRGPPLWSTSSAVPVTHLISAPFSAPCKLN